MDVGQRGVRPSLGSPSPDGDGPYIEIMAGVYTDNQPDFSFLAPYETRTFTEYWYPIREIGPARMANVEGAISMSAQKGKLCVGVAVSRVHHGAVVRVEENGKRIARWRTDLAPDAPFVAELKSKTRPEALTVTVEEAGGPKLIRSRPEPAGKPAPPARASEPPLAADVTSVDRPYWTGIHLEQYRHPTRMPEDYWREALRRDPGDARCNNALGRWFLRRGQLREAAACFRTAIATMTERNANPYCGEPYYNLGLTLRYLGEDHQAYDTLYKATWNYSWRSSAYLALSEMDARAQRWGCALEHAQLAMRGDTDN